MLYSVEEVLSLSGWSSNGIHGPVVRVYQLPVEGSSGESVILTEQSAVVLCLCLYAQSLHYLRQVDEVLELDRFVGAVYMCVCVCICVCVCVCVCMCVCVCVLWESKMCIFMALKSGVAIPDTLSPTALYHTREGFVL